MQWFRAACGSGAVWALIFLLAFFANLPGLAHLLTRVMPGISPRPTTLTLSALYRTRRSVRAGRPTL